MVLHAAADRIIPSTLELGGKSPVIVFPDSDTDATAAGVITGMRFSRQGQSCTAGSRLLLHADVFDSFLERLASQLGRLKVGDPLDEETDVGALINERQYERVRGYVAGAVEAGGRLCAGSVPRRSRSPASSWTRSSSPTSAKGWAVVVEEVFGPVLIADPGATRRR